MATTETPPTPGGGWRDDELGDVAVTDDLHIAPFRSDGVTFGTLTWIWSVVLDSELYVRAYNGTASRWYQAAKAQGAGRITAAGREFEVSFELGSTTATFPEEAIDEAYRSKYATSPYLDHMISGRAKAATVRIIPKTHG